MIIGEHKPVLAHQDPRSEAIAPIRGRGHARATEEAKERVVGRSSDADLLGGGDVDDAPNDPLCHVGEPTLGGKGVGLGEKRRGGGRELNGTGKGDGDGANEPG